MKENTALKDRMVRFINTLRFSGFGFIALASIVFVFSKPDRGGELNGFTLILALIAVSGVVMLLCSFRLVKILMGYGNMDPPPVTLNPPKDRRAT